MCVCVCVFVCVCVICVYVYMSICYLYSHPDNIGKRKSSILHCSAAASCAVTSSLVLKQN